MNTVDINTILISLVVILVILVIARISILRYRMSHIKLPENVREAGKVPADSSIPKKNQAKSSVSPETDTLPQNKPLEEETDEKIKEEKEQQKK